jgi:hypothetical protein
MRSLQVDDVVVAAGAGGVTLSLKTGHLRDVAQELSATFTGP